MDGLSTSQQFLPHLSAPCVHRQVASSCLNLGVLIALHAWNVCAIARHVNSSLLEAIRCPNRAAARAGRRVFVSCLAIVSVINVTVCSWVVMRSLRMVINDQADLLGAVAVAKES